MTPACRCCGREFGEFDADEVMCDPASGAVILLVAPADLLCGPCGDPESRPFAHAEAHEE